MLSFDCFRMLCVCTSFDSVFFSLELSSSSILLFVILSDKHIWNWEKKEKKNLDESKKETLWSLISRQSSFLCILEAYETNQTNQSGIVFNFPSSHRIFLDILNCFRCYHVQFAVFFFPFFWTITNNFIMWWHSDRWQNGNGVAIQSVLFVVAALIQFYCSLLNSCFFKIHWIIVLAKIK